MTAGAFFEDFRQIDGRTWRSCRTALPPLTEPHLAAKAAEARSTLNLGRDTLVLGCIGRDEKMLGEGYLEAVAAILKVREGTEFVWTGRAQVRAPDVQRKLEQLGVAARCKFLGWVPNTKIVAHMLDVYLDSFPFASGHTGFEAMAAGVPMVVLATGQALDSSTLTSLVPVLRGQTGTVAERADVSSIFADPDGTKLVPYVESIDEYVARAIELIRDASLRRRVGDAGRRFVERFARDEKGFAVSTCRHILDIIAETRTANVSGHAANV
jgi:predicted O-linked N-acetylglucosamine transferase (SPINDLY family)